MRVKKVQTGDPALDKAFAPIVSALQAISKDNMATTELTGTTNSTADTKQVFDHRLGTVPSFWFVLEGDIYIPRYGAGTSTIDIRSRRSSEPFRILLVS